MTCEAQIKEISRIIAEIEQDISEKRQRDEILERARNNTRSFAICRNIIQA